VEQTAGGYQVALKYAAGNQFSIWHTDSNGNFVSYAVYAGNSATLKSLETSFHQDLNGDSTVGAAAVTSQALAAPEGIGNAFLNPGETNDTFRFAAEFSQTVGTLSDQPASDHRWLTSDEFHSLLFESATARIELALDSFGHEALAPPAGHLLDSEPHHFIIR
jgi:hypothetical protein